MEIRYAQPEDAENILKFVNQVGGESDNLLYGAEGLDIDLEGQQKFIVNINQSKNDLYLICTNEQNEVIGTLQLGGNRRERISHVVRMAMAVRKDYWGKGISKQLMESMIEYAQDNDIEIVTLEVFEDNFRGVKLYEKYGFEKIGYFKHFAKVNGKYKNAILMNLYL